MIIGQHLHRSFPEFLAARDEYDRGSALYNEQKDNPWVGASPHDPKAICQSMGALAIWSLRRVEEPVYFRLCQVRHHPRVRGQEPPERRLLLHGAHADLVEDLVRVLAADKALWDNRADWFASEVLHHAKRVLKRLDLTARSFFALIDAGSCFAGSLFELALAALGDRAAIPILLNSLDDPDMGVREAAIAALERLGGKPPAEGKKGE